MIDDEMLIAFADGELNAVDRERVEEAFAADPTLRARLETQQRLRERLVAHYAPVEEEEVPERLRAMLDRKVVELAAARERRVRPLWQTFTALAATLVLGLAIGRSVEWPGDAGPVEVQDGTLVAEGPLAQALDAQLASAQAPDAATRIGFSFASADGRLCRTFDSVALAGLACRGDNGWQLMMTAAGSGPRTAYRQAGSNPLVLEAANALMAGEAFDAEAERQARDSGWRRSPAAR
jgi:hypothetical protein